MLSTGPLIFYITGHRAAIVKPHWQAVGGPGGYASFLHDPLRRLSLLRGRMRSTSDGPSDARGGLETATALARSARAGRTGRAFAATKGLRSSGAKNTSAKDAIAIQQAKKLDFHADSACKIQGTLQHGPQGGAPSGPLSYGREETAGSSPAHEVVVAARTGKVVLRLFEGQPPTKPALRCRAEAAFCRSSTRRSAERKGGAADQCEAGLRGRIWLCRRERPAVLGASMADS